MQFSSDSFLEVILRQSIKCGLQTKGYLHHIGYVNKQSMLFGASKNPLRAEELPLHQASVSVLCGLNTRSHYWSNISGRNGKQFRLFAAAS
jgi:hypothetical protein